MGMAALLWAGPARAITVDELRARRDAGEAYTLIDIRRSVFFRRGHIPGALNIRGKVLETKRLPHLGSVVVIGNGLEVAATMAAVESLDARPGIDAEMLEGGMPAWESRNFQRTGKREDVQRYPVAELPWSDFDEVAKTSPDVVLVDLRQRIAGKTDLGRKYPDVRRIGPFAARRGESAAKRAIRAVLRLPEVKTAQLIALIDDADGTAEKVARRLRAGGVRRVAVLIGGERALATDGQPISRHRILDTKR